MDDDSAPTGSGGEPEASPTAESTAEALLARAGSLLWSGRPEASLIESNRAAVLRAGFESAQQHLAWQFVTYRCAALIFTGDADTAVAVAERGFDAFVRATAASPPPSAESLPGTADPGGSASFDAQRFEAVVSGFGGRLTLRILALTRALACLMAGRSADAVEWAREASAHLPFGHRLATAFAELAHLDGAHGDRRVLRGTLARSEAFGFGPGLILVRLMDAGAARASAFEGDLAGAVKRSMALSRSAARRGEPLVELIALHDVVRFGEARQAALRLAGLAGAVEGEFARVCAAHADAAARSDAADLLTVSGEFERMGMPLYAAESAAQGARVLLASGGVDQGNAASARAWFLAGLCQGALTPALSELLARDLSPRELEIAQLAAASDMSKWLSSKDIGATLGMSTRAVDSRLRSAYTKLGVTGRAELASVLTRRGSP